jgi:hypothetical protein
MRQSGVVNVVVDLPSAVFDQYIAGFESCLACRTILGTFTDFIPPWAAR